MSQSTLTHRQFEIKAKMLSTFWRHLFMQQFSWMGSIIGLTLGLWILESWIQYPFEHFVFWITAILLSIDLFIIIQTFYKLYPTDYLVKNFSSGIRPNPNIYMM